MARYIATVQEQKHSTSIKESNSMKSLLAVASLSLCLASVSGCGWFSANEKVLSADGLSLVSCVTGNAGQPVEVIAVVCGGLLVSDTVAILDAAHITPVVSPAVTAYRVQHPSPTTVLVKVVVAPAK